MRHVRPAYAAFVGAVTATVLATSLLVAPAAHAITDVERFFETSSIGPEMTKTLTVHCPRGKKVVSGGAEINYAEWGARIIGLEPDTANGDWFRADAALEPPSFPGWSVDWSLTVSIVCAVPPRGGLHYGTTTVAAGSQQTRAAQAYCPSGEALVGFGGRVATMEEPRNVALTGVFPPAGPNTNKVAAMGAEMNGGESRDWSVTAYTVCAAGVPGQEAVVTSQDYGDLTEVVNSATCPAPKKLLAAGAGSAPVPPWGDWVINSLGPTIGHGVKVPNDTTARAVYSEDLTGSNGSPQVWTVAVCAQLASEEE